MTRSRPSTVPCAWASSQLEPTAKAEPTAVDVGSYTSPFLDFITNNPTVFHAVDYVSSRLKQHGFQRLSERDPWAGKLSRGGKYFVERNGSSLIAFTVGSAYEPGNGAAVIASHIDALTARLKPIPTLPNKAGYVQLGVAPYAHGLNKTWWDRDLGVGGRVLVRDGNTGKIETKLVKLGWPIARIPTLAEHFGAVASDPHPNLETQAVPIIGLDNSDSDSVIKAESFDTRPSCLSGAGTFASTQPPRLVKAIASELGVQDYSAIVNWELELFDPQPAQLGGLEKEFIFAPRIDDKLCSFAAVEALLASTPTDSSVLKIAAVFDDEEIGSLLKQGAGGNFLPATIERTVASFVSPPSPFRFASPYVANYQEYLRAGTTTSIPDLLLQTYARSFLVSADVSHAINPNYVSAYLPLHAPRLNTGVAVQADPNGNTTTDAVSTALLQCVAQKCDAVLQVFQIRNGERSGGTVGPMLSAKMGMRAVDAGLPQLSMHSIRATVGDKEPGLGVKLFKGFYDYYEEVDREFASS
ncbi:MAG: hypothetical protein LQ342_000005 [Letrouitia transgressa]|nr:MAG: hypothetical protein LQ342_000005 [Letrouitia transgressa]